MEFVRGMAELAVDIVFEDPFTATPSVHAGTVSGPLSR